MTDEFADALVNSLINPFSKRWDVDLLNLLFLAQESKLIQSIPLCRNDVEDKLI